MSNGSTISRVTEMTQPMLELLEKQTPLTLKVSALYNAYGLNSSEVTFYADDTDKLLMVVQGDFCSVLIKDATIIPCLKELLSFLATHCISEIPLYMEGYHTEEGSSFLGKCKNSLSEQEFTEDLSETYDILSKTFESGYEQEYFDKWYVNASHLKRHVNTQVFTIKGVATVTAYYQTSSSILVTELATIPDYRKQGYASGLLGHISKVNQDKPIMLMSQSMNSDMFYELNGFKKISSWYYYMRQIV